MSKKINIQNYQNAYDILYGEWLSVHPTDCQNEDEQECRLFANTLLPDQTVLKNEAFTILSEEAKEIINTILFTPVEIIDLIATPKTKKITLRGIKRYFAKKWKSAFIVEITIKEVKEWVNKL